jgi:hypothetical protein
VRTHKEEDDRHRPAASRLAMAAES